VTNPWDILKQRVNSTYYQYCGCFSFQISDHRLAIVIYFVVLLNASELNSYPNSYIKHSRRNWKELIKRSKEDLEEINKVNQFTLVCPLSFTEKLCSPNALCKY
jgi:hypothetical protein